jgi:hypothetical protein
VVTKNIFFCGLDVLMTLPDSPKLLMCSKSFHKSTDGNLQPEKELHHGLLMNQSGQPPIHVFLKIADLTPKLAQREAACQRYAEGTWVCGAKFTPDRYLPDEILKLAKDAFFNFR